MANKLLLCFSVLVDTMSLFSVVSSINTFFLIKLSLASFSISHLFFLNYYNGGCQGDFLILSLILRWLVGISTKEEIFLFSLCMYVGTYSWVYILFSRFQSVIFMFWCSSCPVGQQEPLQAGPCVPCLPPACCKHLFSGATKPSRLILCFPCHSPWISHFSKEPLLLSVVKSI